MKMVNYSILRSISALVIGGLLVFWSQNAVVYLIMAVGFMFLIPGLFSILSYVLSKKNGKSILGWAQILGIGSTLFGLALVIYPVFFETSLMYALGVILSYAGISEIVDLVAARRYGYKVAKGYYVIPVLIVLAGLFILFNPIKSANIPFIILGIGCLVYGVSNLVNLVKFRHRNDNIEEIVSIEEMSSEEFNEE